MGNELEDDVPDNKRNLRIDARVISLNLVSYSRHDDEGVLAEASMGRTLDISPGGIKLEVDHHIPLSSVINLSVALRDDVISIKGRVVHLEELKNGKIGMGIEFVDVDEETGETLRKFLSV
jgi:c-di-GMP-binding flagellar brake protein YcgR